MNAKTTYLSIALLLIALMFSININAQIGINTSDPADGSILDVESINKGIFIPRVNIISLSSIAPITGIGATAPELAAAASLLVYNTNVTTGEGFYYWDGTEWIALTPAEDGDFHQEGTSSAPTDISQDVFRTGNVAIGKTTANYALDIEDDSSIRATSILTTGATASGGTTGVRALHVENSNTSNSTLYGIYSYLRNNTGTGSRYGMYNNVQIPGVQTNQAFGIYNNLTAGTGGNASQTGTFNRLGGNVYRAKTGVSNFITGTDNSTHIGVSNNVASSGTGSHIGTQNKVEGTGNLKGTYNTFNSSSGNGDNRGMETQNTNDGNGEHQGVHSRLDGDGSGNKIGNINYITGQGGDHYGTNNVLKRDGSQSGTTGTGVKYGTYNNITDSEGDNYGVYNLITGTVTGKTSYGSYTDINSTTGTNIGGYFTAHGVGATANYAAIFDDGLVVVNESGNDNDFRVEGNTDNDLLFTDASTDRVGVGTNTPNATLDVRGAAIFNEAAGNNDIRVEGDTDANLLFTDASTNNVGIGTSTPSEKLEVSGKIQAVDINFSGIPNGSGGLSSGDVYRSGSDLRIVP